MSRRFILMSAVAALVSALSSTPALAEPITFMFSGEVTHVFDPDDLLGGNVTPGTPFSGMYTFESTTPDVDPQARLGRYTGAIVELTGDIGGIPFNGPTTATSIIRIGNGDFSAEPDAYDLIMQVSFVDQRLSLALSLLDLDATALDDDSLPLAPPNIMLFERASFAIGNETIVTVDGTLSQLVPEPGALGLLVVGGGVAATRRQFRRRRDVART